MMLWTRHGLPLHGPQGLLWPRETGACAAALVHTMSTESGLLSRAASVSFGNNSVGSSVRLRILMKH